MSNDHDDDGEIEWDDEDYPLDPDSPEGEMMARRAMFRDPGGRSSLRAASHHNPRNLPCPTCGEPNRLTPADKAQGYQCDACADLADGTGW